MFINVHSARISDPSIYAMTTISSQKQTLSQGSIRLLRRYSEGRPGRNGDTGRGRSKQGHHFRESSRTSLIPQTAMEYKEHLRGSCALRQKGVHTPTRASHPLVWDGSGGEVCDSQAPWAL